MGLEDHRRQSLSRQLLISSWFTTQNYPGGQLRSSDSLGHTLTMTHERSIKLRVLIKRSMNGTVCHHALQYRGLGSASMLINRRDREAPTDGPDPTRPTTWGLFIILILSLACVYCANLSHHAILRGFWCRFPTVVALTRQRRHWLSASRRTSPAC